MGESNHLCTCFEMLFDYKLHIVFPQEPSFFQIRLIVLNEWDSCWAFFSSFLFSVQPRALLTALCWALHQTWHSLTSLCSCFFWCLCSWQKNEHILLASSAQSCGCSIPGGAWGRGWGLGRLSWGAPNPRQGVGTEWTLRTRPRGWIKVPFSAHSL